MATRSLAGLLAAAAGLLALATPAPEAGAASVYEPTRAELEQVLEDLSRWLPGAWDSYPQVHYERTVRAPKAGEHEHWHRVFARIDAPQIGSHVFYGQIHVGGRAGPILPGSQILYNATIDEARGVVSVIGQGPLEREKYENLQDRPELWKSVRQRDPGAVRCDFVWRRSGAQIVGVLEGRRPESRKYGPGTCTYMAGGNKDVEFFADAEWVLGPEELWLYDINKMAGRVFVGREDQTHIRLYRAHPFRCTVSDASGTRVLEGHDRGYVAPVVGGGGRKLDLMLLRASLPRGDGAGLRERLRLTITEPGATQRIAGAEAEAEAGAVAINAEGIEARCERAERFESPAGVEAGT